MKVVPCYIFRVEKKGRLFKEMWNEAKFDNDRWNQVKVNLQLYMHAQFLVTRNFLQVKSEITVRIMDIVINDDRQLYVRLIVQGLAFKRCEIGTGKIHRKTHSNNGGWYILKRRLKLFTDQLKGHWAWEGNHEASIWSEIITLKEGTSIKTSIFWKPCTVSYTHLTLPTKA